MKIQIPKGLFDILPREPDPSGAWRETFLWEYLEQKIKAVATAYGYEEIRTPIFERTELFARGVGETTDIVSKEMYTFEDKGKRSMTLRPEGTAPVMRAFIEKNLGAQGADHKFFYIGPMFRHERPQSGRYRQHHQFGIEAIGSRAPEQDVEVIDLLYSLYAKLGLQNLTICLNSLGEPKTRKEYREQLKQFLEPHFKKLSEDSQNRYEVNPLRILDSKDPGDQEILKDAPSILDLLNVEDQTHFNYVQSLLDTLAIPYQVQPTLVRGLDYYTGTVFEIMSGELGAQNTIGAGGRYDGLLKRLGGPDLPAFGFGSGLERIIQTMLAQKVPLPSKPKLDLFIIPLGDQAKQRCFRLIKELRREGISTQMDYSGKKLKQSMRFADQRAVRYVAVIGDSELESDDLQLKHMEDFKAHPCKLSQLVEEMKKLQRNKD